MAGEVLNMNDLTINKHRCKLKGLCFKTATKPYTKRYKQAGEKIRRKENDNYSNQKNENLKPLRPEIILNQIRLQF